MAPKEDCCHSVVDALSDHLEGRVGFWDRLRLKFHLFRCPICMRYFRQFKKVYQSCDQMNCEDLPEDFDRIMSKVLGQWKGNKG